MRVLLTGFGPYAHVKENNSTRLVNDIQRDWKRNDCELKTLIMPVAWAPVEVTLETIFLYEEPDLALFLTHAPRYPVFTLEQRYYNRAVGPDEFGGVREDEVIKPDGEDFYLSNIPRLSSLVAYLNKRGVPAVLHDGPEGMDYLCNFVGYLAGYWVGQRAEEMKYLMLHIPPPDDLPYETGLQGVRLILKFLTNSI